MVHDVVVVRATDPLAAIDLLRLPPDARGELGNGNKKKGEGESSESDDELPELPWLPSPRLEPARSGERCSDTDSDASFARTDSGGVAGTETSRSLTSSVRLAAWYATTSS